MKNGLNGFPLDNSMSTQIKYDLFAEKMNNAQRSYNIRNQSSTSDAVMLVGGLFQIVFGLIFMVFTVLRCIWIQSKINKEC
jgi:hypothetical protein